MTREGLSNHGQRLLTKDKDLNGLLNHKVTALDLNHNEAVWAMI
jgi:hypothetical protein